jgi:hypothetical protein
MCECRDAQADGGGDVSWEFHVGQRVVCVDDDWDMPPRQDGIPWVDEPCRIKRGRVYTICHMYVCPLDGFLCLALSEVPRTPVGIAVALGVTQLGFRATRFRPIQTRKTDISCFTAMLNPQRKRVSA